jgi:hypothetical protein
VLGFDLLNEPIVAQEIDRAFEGYLKAVKFKNCDIRWSYLAALGLKAGP